MESLPTVCDLEPQNKRGFTWPAQVETPATSVAEEVTSGALGALECHVNPKAAQDNEHEYVSDACFSSDVFAELMAAPSPAAVPMAMFANTDPYPQELTFNQALHKETNDENLNPDQLFPSDPVLPANISILPAAFVPQDMGQWDMAPVAADVAGSKLNSIPQRVAELEGALEESRDRVKELEKTLEKNTGETTAKHCDQHAEHFLTSMLTSVQSIVTEQKNTGAKLAAEHCDHMPHFGTALQSQCWESPSVKSEEVEAASQQSRFAKESWKVEAASPWKESWKVGGQVEESESVYSEACSARESIGRLEELLSRIAAEEQLLKRATEIADLRRAVREMAGNHEVLEVNESLFAELQKEIKERELKLSELSQVNQKKEQDLERLRASLQTREQANAKFEEYMYDLECKLINASKPFVKRPARHSMPCGTPPKLPQPRPRALLGSARASSRSPSPSGSVSVSAGGVAGRAAAEAAAAVASAMARQGGPTRRAASAHGATSAVLGVALVTEEGRGTPSLQPRKSASRLYRVIWGFHG